jgi:hypothetical protein
MTDDALLGLARWHGRAFYRADAGLIEEEVFLHRIADLSEWVEPGPPWDTIERIEIRPINHKHSAALSSRTLCPVTLPTHPHAMTH